MRQTLWRLMVVLVMIHGSSTVALATGFTGLDANPNPFYQYDGINVTAWIFSDDSPEYWCTPDWGCYWDGYAFVDVSGSDGFYAWGEAYGGPYAQTYGWDGVPGQTMQPTSYWAHGGVQWTVWYCIFGCTEETWWDDGGWVQRTVNPEWPIPYGESTYSDGWATWNTTVHRWIQVLAGSSSFAGRFVSEENPGGGGPDTCHFVGSIIAESTGITGGTWQVGGSDQWGPDNVGWLYEAVLYYRNQGRAPCETQFPQRMRINRPGNSSVEYVTNLLRMGMTAISVWSERAGQYAERIWP